MAYGRAALAADLGVVPTDRKSKRGRLDVRLSVIAWSAAAVLAAGAGPGYGEALDANVLAQVTESGGYSPTPLDIRVRILSDGRIEEFAAGQWRRVAKLEDAALRRFKRVTDVMTPRNLRSERETGLVDASVIRYLVRNRAGDTVVVGTDGPTRSVLMQGGATSLIQVLDGLRALVRISY